jgi:hypothetical protein
MHLLDATKIKFINKSVLTYPAVHKNTNYILRFSGCETTSADNEYIYIFLNKYARTNTDVYCYYFVNDLIYILKSSPKKIVHKYLCIDNIKTDSVATSPIQIPSKLVLIDEQISKFDIFAFDFDNTLVAINASVQGKAVLAKKLETGDILDDFPDSYISTLLHKILSNGKKIVVVSFGTYEIIKTYMDFLMNDTSCFDEFNIMTPRLMKVYKLNNNHNKITYKIGVEYERDTNKYVGEMNYRLENYKLSIDSKANLLGFYMDIANVADKNKVLFFDDCESNVKGCINNGYQNSFVASKPVTCCSLIESLYAADANKKKSLADYISNA